MYALITGFMEAGETPQEGIAREIKEETNLDASELKLVGVYDFQRMNQVIIVYHAVADGEVKLSPELVDYRLYDLADLPTSDFYVHTLNFSGITQYAVALQDEMQRLPPLSHLKEVYVNGRLWYDQPIPLVASTLGLLSASNGIEKLIISKPVQTLIPLDDTVLKNLEHAFTVDAAADACVRLQDEEDDVLLARSRDAFLDAERFGEREQIARGLSLELVEIDQRTVAAAVLRLVVFLVVRVVVLLEMLAMATAVAATATALLLLLLAAAAALLLLLRGRHVAAAVAAAVTARFRGGRWSVVRSGIGLSRAL